MELTKEMVKEISESNKLLSELLKKQKSLSSQDIITALPNPKYLRDVFDNAEIVAGYNLGLRDCIQAIEDLFPQ